MTRLGSLWLALSIATLAAACDRNPGPPPELGALPPFELTDQGGGVVTQETLAGRPAIVNFIYTRCPDRCPIFTARFANLQRKLGAADVAFVSISVDPEYDSPQVLAEYADKYDAQAPAWRFVTGPLQNGLSEAVIAAFREHLEGRDIQGELDLLEIVHGELFVLVDAQGAIRGFYGSSDPSIERLQRALKALD